MALITFLLVNLFSTTILNEQYILSKLQEVDYYNKMYDYVQSCFEKYIGQSGLDEEILNNVVSKEKIKNDTQIIISNIYDAGKKLRKNIVCPDIIIYRLQACRLPQEVYFRQE